MVLCGRSETELPGSQRRSLKKAMRNGLDGHGVTSRLLLYQSFPGDSDGTGAGADVVGH